MLRHMARRVQAIATYATADARPLEPATPAAARRRWSWPRSRRACSSRSRSTSRAGGPGGWLARHQLPAPYVAGGQRFDIGGRALYLDCRGTGTPTVVLEAGSGADSSTWAAVHDELAATTRTCAYDRAGRGRSDPRDRGTRSPTRPRTCGACWPRPASSRRSSWSAIRSAARTAACSPRRTGRTSPASSWSTRSSRTSRRTGSTRCSARSAASTRHGSTACAPTSRPSTRSTGRRARRSSGRRRWPGCRSRSSWRRAASRASTRPTNEAIADAWQAGIESLSPGIRRPHDRVGRRPQHPDRPAGPGHRRGTPPGRAGSLTRGDCLRAVRAGYPRHDDAASEGGTSRCGS